MSNTKFAITNRNYNRRVRMGVRSYSSNRPLTGRSTVVTVLKNGKEYPIKYKNVEKQGLLNNIVKNGK